MLKGIVVTVGFCSCMPFEDSLPSLVAYVGYIPQNTTFYTLHTDVCGVAFNIVFK